MTHVEGEVNPVRDLEIIGEELRLKDVETIDKSLEKMERTVIRANDKKAKPEYVSHKNNWYSISFSILELYKYRRRILKIIQFVSQFLFQDTLVKVKGVLCDEKKHIRFADWSAHDVSNLDYSVFLFEHKLKLILIFMIQ